MRALLRFFGYLICLAVIGVVCLYFFVSDLPDHNALKVYSPDVATRVFLKDGTKLCEYANEKRYFIPIEKIPNKLINAFIAAEDKHYYQHPGVDFLGIARSIVQNIKNISTGKRPHGASTITQQVARIFLIKDNKVSYVRKIKEAILAWRIESALSKQQILELYLNQIYMGMGLYGVAAAAKGYFNKTVNELTIAECSYLAAVVKGANNYHPVKHKQKALDRRNWVIARQLEDGLISAQEARLATAEDLIMAENTSNPTIGYYAEEVRKYLIANFATQKNLNKSGFIVRATLDPHLQQCAYQALRSGLERIDRRLGWRGPVGNVSVDLSRDDICRSLKENISIPKGCDGFEAAAIIKVNKQRVEILVASGETGSLTPEDASWAKDIRVGDVVFVSKSKNNLYCLRQVPAIQGGLLVMDVDTGRILAMQGGYAFEQSEFNRALQSSRPIGSVFKPFVYLAALENGFAPNTIVNADAVTIDMGGATGIWSPRNYNGVELGNLTLRKCLARSVNTATVRIAKTIGLRNVISIARLFGIFDNMPAYYSYVLGAGESTLIRLTAAYAMLANGGKRIHPVLVDYVQDRYGRIVFTGENKRLDRNANFDEDYPPFICDDREQLLDEQSVYQVTSILHGAMKIYAATRDLYTRIPMAGKTGTSNESRDVWFVGYTSDLAIGVFVGFDDHTKSLGKTANGANTALPIFADFVRSAKLQPKPFRVPRGIHLRKIDAQTGAIPTSTTVETVIEAFKDDEGPIDNTNNSRVEPEEEQTSLPGLY